LVIDDYFLDGGPIFFYTGNEAGIDTFVLAANTGLQVDLAPQFHALVVSAEHRYYGQSLPFGNASWDANNIGYLAVEQAIADYAVLIVRLKETYPTAGKVITFGGSYGALLSAWMRMHYPDLVYGAIASAAPLDFYQNMTAWMQGVTQTYMEIPGCAENIHHVFTELYNGIAANNKTILGSLQKSLDLCYPVEDVVSGFQLLEYTTVAFGFLAQFGYPYPLVVDLAWPVPYVCKTFASQDAYASVKYALGLVYNNSRIPRPCFDYNNLNIQNLTTIQTNSWNYQCCTEIWLGTATDGVHDMFYPSSYTIYDLYALCTKQYNVHAPNFRWTMEQLGGPDIGDTTNIVFINGGHDPVRMFAPKGNVTIINIPRAGHCLDLYPIAWLGAQAYPELLAARKLEAQFINSWVNA